MSRLRNRLANMNKKAGVGNKINRYQELLDGLEESFTNQEIMNDEMGPGDIEFELEQMNELGFDFTQEEINVFKKLLS